MFKQFKNKKVLIQGLGLNDGGVGMAKFFLENGAKVTVTDLRDEKVLAPSIKALKDYKVHYVLGEHREEDFKNADIVVRNPAVKPNNKFIELAKANGAKVYMEMSLFFDLAPGLTVGITGTRGKSTTTSLIYEFLSNCRKLKNRHNFLLAGNIGKSAVTELESLNESTISILELSSFQLSVMRENKQSPNVAVVTNIYPDHLNWHPDMQDYIEAKRTILEFQTNDDYAVINLDDPIVSKFLKYTKAHVYGITRDKKALIDSRSEPLSDVFFMDKNGQVFNNAGELVADIQKARHLKLKGDHNLTNILTAIAVAKLPVFSVSNRTITAVLNKFTGLFGRQQFVRSVKGIDFYNDTTATMDVAVKTAVKRFSDEYKGNVIFIMGGVDKGIDYKTLVHYMKGKIKALVLVEGTASEKISAEAVKKNIETYAFFNSMQSAVQKAYELAQEVKQNTEEKVAVVLSPGGSSFNMFLNEWDRGRRFEESVNKLS